MEKVSASFLKFLIFRNVQRGMRRFLQLLVQSEDEL